MTARRRPALHKHQQAPTNNNNNNSKDRSGMFSAAPSPRVINAAPSLEKAEMFGIENDRPVFSRAMALAGRVFIETIPQWLTVAAMLSLIFGGCCSNVYSLEAIIKVEPASGMFTYVVLHLLRDKVPQGGSKLEVSHILGSDGNGLTAELRATGTLLTFVQFVFVAAVGLPSQFDSRRPPFYLKPNKVPIRRWLVNIVLFFSINVLNNHAFSYDISVPVHIILRSGGSITTMIAGSLYGKKYSRIQVVAVLLLTVGVITAAWSDAQTKVNIYYSWKVQVGQGRADM